MTLSTVVIFNPPYFKLNKADPRAQAAATVVHGQPNIYGLFMAVGAVLLRQGGDFVSITPRSFASGPYFRLFRERFFEFIRPVLVHVFGSRRDAFNRDAVLQENVILKGVRQDGWLARKPDEHITISSSNGVVDLDAADSRSVRVASKEKVLRLPVSDAEENLTRLVDSWPGSLRAYGLQISTGPVVPFRATEFIDKEGEVPDHSGCGTERGAALHWLRHPSRVHLHRAEAARPEVGWDTGARIPVAALPSNRFLAGVCIGPAVPACPTRSWPAADLTTKGAHVARVSEVDF